MKPMPEAKWPRLRLSPSDIKFYAASGPADPELYAVFISEKETEALLSEAVAKAVREAKLEQLDEWIDLLTKAIMTERGMPLSQRGKGAQDCRIDFISILKSDKKKLVGPKLPAKAAELRENGEKDA